MHGQATIFLLSRAGFLAALRQESLSQTPSAPWQAYLDCHA